MSNLKVEVLLKAVDQATRPFKSVENASKALSGDIKNSQAALKDLNAQAGKIDGFRKSSAQLGVTSQKLKEAKAEAAALAIGFKNTANPTRAQAQAMEAAKRTAAQLQTQFNGLRQSVQRQRTELSQAGISTRTLSESERRLKTSISETTAQLNRQRESLARVSAQQAKLNAVKGRYQAGKQLAGSVTGAGAAGVGIATAGTAAGVGLLMPGFNFAQKNSELQATLGLEKDSADMTALRTQARQLGDSGKPIPQMTIVRSDGDGHTFNIADRGAYTGVSASWLHTKDPKPKKVKVQRKPKLQYLRALQHPKAKKVSAKVQKTPEAKEGDYLAGSDDNVFTLTTIYATQKAAMRAAQAKWDKLQRGVAEFSISLARGRADLFPETPVAVSGFKSVIDAQPWIISKVTHSLGGSGFVTALSLEVLLSDVNYEATESDGAE